MLVGRFVSMDDFFDFTDNQGKIISINLNSVLKISKYFAH